MKRFKRFKTLKRIGYISGFFLKKKPLKKTKKNFLYFKNTDFSNQLKKKQKIKKSLLINEKQFRNICKNLCKKNNFKFSIPMRFDNVIFSCFKTTKFKSRQMINHRHFKVNDKVCNKPSRIIKVKDIIEFRKKNKIEEFSLKSDEFFDFKKKSILVKKLLNDNNNYDLSFYTR